MYLFEFLILAVGFLAVTANGAALAARGVMVGARSTNWNWHELPDGLYSKILHPNGTKEIVVLELGTPPTPPPRRRWRPSWRS